MTLHMPVVFPVTCHTDFVGEHSVFVAIKGYADDGVRYIVKAIEKGARTIIVEDQVHLDDVVMACIKRYRATVIRVSNARRALAEMSAEYAGFPAQQLKIIGITGTKGKTTTSFLLAHMLKRAGYRVALLSTVYNIIGDTQYPAP